MVVSHPRPERRHERTTVLSCLDHLVVRYEEDVPDGFLDDRESQLSRARDLETIRDRLGHGDRDALTLAQRLSDVVTGLRLDSVDLD